MALNRRLIGRRLRESGSTLFDRVADAGKTRRRANEAVSGNKARDYIWLIDTTQPSPGHNRSLRRPCRMIQRNHLSG
ncbi:hypothetical protein [Pseudomonas sp. UBA6310]|uniref:hypothetical protein n=1 Tax=Pseudomonas sp. UBA6310 TaxID=1947327 RepID=UPI00257DA901|nr:hypothetical protein [Pseudomonas sp. UBA6310]